jgi:hypothetical protein
LLFTPALLRWPCPTSVLFLIPYEHLLCVVPCDSNYESAAIYIVKKRKE